VVEPPTVQRATFEFRRPARSIPGIMIRRPGFVKENIWILYRGFPTITKTTTMASSTCQITHVKILLLTAFQEQRSCPTCGESSVRLTFVCCRPSVNFEPAFDQELLSIVRTCP
jgi:hypothetical protein